MVRAFSDEERCRRLMESMIWPTGRVCPACGYRRSIALAGRDMGNWRARPGLYQCSNGNCRFQFTVTTRTPLHSTKLPLSTWLKALWLTLQSDKGLSSVRLAEALGVSQPTAWRMGHALRLMMARETQLQGTVEIDDFYLGGRPRKQRDAPPVGRGRKGQKRTARTPVLAVVERPHDAVIGTVAGGARAAVVVDLSAIEAERVLEKEVDVATTHLMSDAWSTFVAIGQNFATHDTVQHARREYARGMVHTNSVEGFNSRVRRTVAGVFHHISPEHADLYFHEMGFRWSQRVVAGQTTRRSPRGRERVRTLWDRIPPAMQLVAVLRTAVGRQLRRTRNGSISIKSPIAAFCL
jgi:transposase-like protein